MKPIKKRKYDGIGKYFFIQELILTQKEQVKQVNTKPNKVEQLIDQIKAYSFKATENNFVSSFFGKLNIAYPKSKIISCSRENTIGVWDIEINLQAEEVEE